MPVTKPPDGGNKSHRNVLVKNTQHVFRHIHKCAFVSSLDKQMDLKDIHESRKLLDGLNNLPTAQG